MRSSGNVLRRAVLASTSMVAMLALASCTDPATKSGAVPWGLVGAASSDGASGAQDGRARVVVFRLAREGESHSSDPLNIYFNDGYHASLLPDARAAVLSMCPGVGRLQVATGGTPGMSAQAGASDSIEMKPGSVHYYQVTSDDSGRPVARMVDAAQAVAVVGTLPQQVHTITRVVPDTCLAETLAPIDVFSISSEALFAFDRADIDGILPSGAEELKRVVDTVSSNFGRIGHVVVKGHTDPTGSSSYNFRLSQDRARSIAMALIDAGLASDRVTYEGLGETKMLLADCAAKHHDRVSVNACNQPNRRVEIEVYERRTAGQAGVSAAGK